MDKLLTNAIDSIVVGVEDYSSGTRARRVSAVRNIHAGILLLYKELLRRKSPPDSDDVLVKKDVRSALRSDGSIHFVGVGPKTVDTFQIEKHFDALGVTVNWKLFRKLSALRNNMEHWYESSLPPVVDQAISTGFVLISEFANFLDTTPVEMLGQDVWQKMFKTNEVNKVEMDAWMQRIAAHKWAHPTARDAATGFLCQSCGSAIFEFVAGPLGEETDADAAFLCRACGEVATFENFLQCMFETAEAYSGEAPEVDTCPECGRESFIVSLGFCAICGTQYQTQCRMCRSILSISEMAYEETCTWCLHRIHGAMD